MTKTKMITVLLTMTTLSTTVMASDKSQTIVYGADNRVETYQASKRDQALASATAGMLSTVEAIDLGDSFMLPPKSISDSMGLCKDERFISQPTSVVCSGFLVGPDLLVTAGHCVTTQARCDEVSFVFDYKLNQKTKRANMIVPKRSVYKCSKVINAKLENLPGDKKDYALVKLDRVVKGKRPLKFRTTGIVDSKDTLVVIGHPSGLPQKVASGASIFGNNSKQSYFKTNLDTFGGNSGSAVFNTKTGTIEGILVRGAKDYVKDEDNGCIAVNRAQEDITGAANLGESVSRITDIPSLKYRSAFLKAATSGDVEKMNKLIKAGVNVDITDNFNNTALHVAARAKNLTSVKFLINKGINLEAKNLAGKTAVTIRRNFNSSVKQTIKLAISKKK